MPRVRTEADLRTKAANKAANIAVRRKGLHTSTMGGAAMVDENKPLTEKQRAYVQARSRGEPVSNAMALAGYNNQISWGHRMEKMPNIRKAMALEAQKYAEASQMTRKKVIDMQLEAFERAKLIDEPASMVSAAREIGKMCGFYEPKKVELTVNGTVKHEIHRFEGMTDSELLEVISQGALPEPP